MEKYQNRLRVLRKTQETGHVVSKTPERVDADIKPTPMASNMLGPLLEAYQETILEKELALEKSNQELATYTKQFHTAKQETQDLKKKLEIIQVHFVFKVKFDKFAYYFL